MPRASAKIPPEKRREYVRRAHENLRNRVLDALGRECACCGESEPMFLTLDHKNDDAHLDRDNRNRRDARIAMRRAIREPHNFQILCFNCNSGRHRNGGICPHREVKDAVRPHALP